MKKVTTIHQITISTKDPNDLQNYDYFFNKRPSKEELLKIVESEDCSLNDWVTEQQKIKIQIIKDCEFPVTNFNVGGSRSIKLGSIQYTQQDLHSIVKILPKLKYVLTGVSPVITQFSNNGMLIFLLFKNIKTKFSTILSRFHRRKINKENQ